MLGVIVYLIVIGVLMWLVNTYIPMADPIKKILNILVVVLVLLWILNMFGLFSGPLSTPLPRIR